MIEYKVDGKSYSLSYSELKEEHERLCAMSDDEFAKNLPTAIHLACVICWLKEISEWALSDTGIIHELAHCIHIPEGNTATLRDIRRLFENSLKLT